MKNPDMNQIYEKYADVVYGFILRMCHDENLAEDILQDTFLKAIEKINTFDQKCKLTTWLCQIAKNTYFDYLRKITKCEEVLLDETLTCDRNNLPEDVAISKDASTFSNCSLIRVFSNKNMLISKVFNSSFFFK